MSAESLGADGDQGRVADGGRGRHITVGDLATRQVVSIAPDRSLRAAAQRMDEHGIGAVVVLDDDGLAGILSERDLLGTIAADIDPDAATVRQHMTAEVITVDVDWAVYEAAAAMTDHHIRHLVVTEGSEVFGVLSVRDVLLAGQRIGLRAGAWAVLRDPLTFTVRERRRLQRSLLGLGAGSIADLDLDAVIAEMIGSWSFAATPDQETIAALDPADRRTLHEAVAQELPSLQRAVHPAPGWRTWD